MRFCICTHCPSAYLCKASTFRQDWAEDNYFAEETFKLSLLRSWQVLSLVWTKSIFLDSLVMRLRTHQTYPRMLRMPCAAPLGCMDLSTIQTDLQCTVLTQHEEFLAAGKYLCRIRHLESWWCRIGPIGFGLIIFDPPIPLTLTTLMASCSTSHFPGDVLREIVVLPCSPPV